MAVVILSSDAAVKSAPGRVQWIIVSAGATGGLWQLNNSTDDTGADVLSGFAQASSNTFLGPFTDEQGTLSGVNFNTAIFADIPGTNVVLTIGFN